MPLVFIGDIVVNIAAFQFHLSGIHTILLASVPLQVPLGAKGGMRRLPYWKLPGAGVPLEEEPGDPRGSLNREGVLLSAFKQNKSKHPTIAGGKLRKIVP